MKEIAFDRSYHIGEIEVDPSWNKDLPQEYFEYRKKWDLATKEHVYGASIVDVIDDTYFNVRHIRALKNGKFIDMGKVYNGNKLGNKKSIFAGKNWPDYDVELIKEETVEIAVQGNGKVRDKLELNADISETDEIKKAKDSEKVKKWLEGKNIVKEIYVKGRLVSLVVK